MRLNVCSARVAITHDYIIRGLHHLFIIHDHEQMQCSHSLFYLILPPWCTIELLNYFKFFAPGCSISLRELPCNKKHLVCMYVCREYENNGIANANFKQFIDFVG